MRSQKATSPAPIDGPIAPDEGSEIMSEELAAAEPGGGGGVSRRTILRLGAVGGVGAALVTAQGIGVPLLAQKGLLSADGAFAATSTALGDNLFYIEAFPTSPLILSPFSDPLPIPKAMAPVPQSEYSGWDEPPGPGQGQQNSLRNQQHQIWPGQIGYPDPLVYKIDQLVRTHAFTTSQVLPINSKGQPTASFDVAGNTFVAGTRRTLPLSTIYGFNGTFPGPMINAEYGRPALVRFANHLDENPMNLDRQDFGAPDWSALIHLHNGHTAPESDGNPHYAMRYGPQHHGFRPGQWVDQMYLNWPAGGDDREKQSFFWFHDHRMDHTGANVYKGMVGLFPIYDPKPLGQLGGTDMGDERQGLRLPGVRTDNPDGSFDVKYDVPLAFFDARLDDGVTMHQDMHDGMGEFPDAKNPATHPEWWGKSFFKHFPNHGFVGDIFTVNGTAYPVMEVDRRKYRFRFLDCSVSRIYEFKLMSSTQGPKSSVSLGYSDTELEGQYRIPDAQQCMKFTQIAKMVACCRSRSLETRSSCGRPSAARSSSTSPSIRMGRRPPRATSST
jgi:FtsP/CotA-like multicopper oxidase with cupredoxin domain